MIMQSKILKNLNDVKGYNETFVFAPVKPLIEMADHLLGNDGCLNFFADQQITNLVQL